MRDKAGNKIPQVTEEQRRKAYTTVAGKGVMMKAKWLNPKPTECNACEGNFLRSTAFVDGAIPTSTGPMWGVFHVTCFKNHGGTYGTGRGQKFDMKTLEKVEG